MIQYFEVSGFKNFQDKIALDFSKTRDYKFNTQCITGGLVGKAIVYGRNSVGKTNFGLALFDIVSHLTNKNTTHDLYSYYLNAQSGASFAEFRYVFRFENDIIDYSYRKDGKQRLIYEKTILNGDLLFEYDYITKDGDISGIMAVSQTLNLKLLDSDCLLRFFINNTVLDDGHPLMQMMTFVSNMLWFRSLDQNRYIGYKSDSKDYYDFIFEQDNLHEFEELLNTAGIRDGLIGMVDSDGNKRLYFNTRTPLPFFRVASNGTKALYTFFYWYKTAENVSLMYIDEFDAFYHFELSETIVSILEKMDKTQVIITSHNTNLMTNRIMRPDCYFILTENKLTSFADATQRELREGHNLEKLYMGGEFNE